jgi:GTP:adenosylcobinamide-phosphate guanylyltransferase
MALITTDWKKELEQVESKARSLLDNEVEPLLDRVVEKASAEVSVAVSKATFELEDTANKFLAELRVQREEMVKQMKSVIRYAALMALGVIVVSVVLIKLVNSF